jgi:hypothetical protein
VALIELLLSANLELDRRLRFERAGFAVHRHHLETVEGVG